MNVPLAERHRSIQVVCLLPDVLDALRAHLASGGGRRAGISKKLLTSWVASAKQCLWRHVISIIAPFTNPVNPVSHESCDNGSCMGTPKQSESDSESQTVSSCHLNIDANACHLNIDAMALLPACSHDSSIVLRDSCTAHNLQTVAATLFSGSASQQSLMYLCEGEAALWTDAACHCPLLFGPKMRAIYGMSPRHVVQVTVTVASSIAPPHVIDGSGRIMNGRTVVDVRLDVCVCAFPVDKPEQMSYLNMMERYAPKGAVEFDTLCCPADNTPVHLLSALPSELTPAQRALRTQAEEDALRERAEALGESQGIKLLQLYGVLSLVAIIPEQPTSSMASVRGDVRCSVSNIAPSSEITVSRWQASPPM
jgi:hypothetical protein